MPIGETLRIFLPRFNLLLVIIVIITLVKLVHIRNKSVYIIPWRFLLLAVLAYSVEEILAILTISELIVIPKLVFPIIELVIICFFIYMVLLQKKYVEMQS